MPVYDLSEAVGMAEKRGFVNVGMAYMKLKTIAEILEYVRS